MNDLRLVKAKKSQSLRAKGSDFTQLLKITTLFVKNLQTFVLSVAILQTCVRSH